MSAKGITLLVMCLLAASSLAVKAQTIDERFIIEAPDSVVERDTVTVRYTIKTQQIQDYISPLFDGFEYIDMNHEIQDSGQNISHTFIFRLVPINTGNLFIGPMGVMSQGEAVISQSKRILVKPDRNFEYAVATLHRLFKNNGMDPDTCEIRFIHKRPEFTIASSVRSRYFAVIANEEFARKLDNPVLAYSFERGMWSLMPEFLNLLNYYSHQLNHIENISIKPNKGCIEPILKDIAWGQDAPFNAECPTTIKNGVTVHTLAGCGPVAFGQIIKHYKLDGGKEPARLLAEIGAAIGTEYGTEVSISYSSNYRKPLVEQFGFSSQLRIISLPQDELFAYTFYELKRGRPVVVMNETHSFICDGHRNGYLHFNLGWKGQCNGYYRIFNAPVSERKDMLYHSMVIGMVPGVHKDASKSVILNRAIQSEEVPRQDR